MALVYQSFAERYHELVTRVPSDDELRKRICREETGMRSRLVEEFQRSFTDLMHIMGVTVGDRKRREKERHRVGYIQADKHSLMILEQEKGVWFPAKKMRTVLPPIRSLVPGFPHAKYGVIVNEEVELRNWIVGVEIQLRKVLEEYCSHSWFLIICLQQCSGKEATGRSRIVREEEEDRLTIRRGVFRYAPPEYFRKLWMERYGVKPTDGEGEKSFGEIWTESRAAIEQEEGDDWRCMLRWLFDMYGVRLFSVVRREVSQRYEIEEEEMSSVWKIICDGTRETFGLGGKYTGAVAWHTSGCSSMLRELMMRSPTHGSKGEGEEEQEVLYDFSEAPSYDREADDGSALVTDATKRQEEEGDEYEELPEEKHHGDEYEELPEEKHHGDEYEELPEEKHHGDEYEELPEVKDHGDEYEELPEVKDHGDEYEELSEVKDHGDQIEEQEEKEEKQKGGQTEEQQKGEEPQQQDQAEEQEEKEEKQKGDQTEEQQKEEEPQQQDQAEEQEEKEEKQKDDQTEEQQKGEEPQQQDQAEEQEEKEEKQRDDQTEEQQKGEEPQQQDQAEEQEEKEEKQKGDQTEEQQKGEVKQQDVHEQKAEDMAAVDGEQNANVDPAVEAGDAQEPQEEGEVLEGKEAAVEGSAPEEKTPPHESSRVEEENMENKNAQGEEAVPDATASAAVQEEKKNEEDTEKVECPADSV